MTVTMSDIWSDTRRLAGRLLAIGLAVALLGVGAGAAPIDATPSAGARRALVIGNGNYRMADLPSTVPETNARRLAEELRHAGFVVDLRENLGKEAMSGALSAFAGKIGRGDEALFFFSGYGIQIGAATYLVPIDADIWTETDVARQSIALADVMGAAAGAGARVTVVILDAARRNPFERRFRTLSSGLAPTGLPRDTILIASADVGQVADDGDGATSLFSSELLKEMRAPNLAVQKIFERTRTGVERATNGAQRPLVLSTLAEDVRLEPAKGVAGSVPDTARASPRNSMPEGEPQPGRVFRDCDRCPDVVVIGPGAFTMGSDDFETEKPVHRVEIRRPFAIGRSEVTFAQWDACVADGGCTVRPSDKGRGRTTLPVEQVSWRDAMGYVDWLKRVSGHAYRLPTEAEWEYAARGDTNSAYWWGDEVGAGQANCRGCDGAGGGRTAPVASYPANPFGLFDTAGNVAEWVADCWTESYAAPPSVADTNACKQRIVRGGSFDSAPRYVRSASRFPYDPDLRYYANGFRVLRELP